MSEEASQTVLCQWCGTSKAAIRVREQSRITALVCQRCLDGYFKGDTAILAAAARISESGASEPDTEVRIALARDASGHLLIATTSAGRKIYPVSGIRSQRRGR